MDINNYTEKIKNIHNSRVSYIYKVDLNKSLIEEFNKIEIELQKITTPVVYWFECENQNDSKELFELFYDKKASIMKSTPPINIENKESKVIYLGVRQGGKYVREKTWSKLKGRIYHHFGLYEKATTQGLQLNEWAYNSGKKINLIINTYHISEVQYLYILEKIYSIELKPMFGKH